MLSQSQRQVCVHAIRARVCAGNAWTFDVDVVFLISVGDGGW